MSLPNYENIENPTVHCAASNRDWSEGPAHPALRLPRQGEDVPPPAHPRGNRWGK